MPDDDHIMSLPLIGITTFHTRNPEKGVTYLSVTEAYAAAMREAGGIPVMIPLGLQSDALERLVSWIDGVIFTGGGDIDPDRYGAPPHPLINEVDPARDELELQLVQAAVSRGVPFLGICRGLQTINVAMGGTLYADIQMEHPNALQHACFQDAPRDHLAHEIRIREGSLLADILGAHEARVNSGHHQGILELAPGLEATAFAPDGIIEAVEISGYPFGLAVQWHPEWITALPPMLGLFKALAQAASERVFTPRP
jgi:putative glutamine amidotransferase